MLAAKRYTFIESGVTHPNFQELFGLVTTRAQQARVQAALGAMLAAAPRAAPREPPPPAAARGERPHAEGLGERERLAQAKRRGVSALPRCDLRQEMERPRLVAALAALRG